MKKEKQVEFASELKLLIAKHFENQLSEFVEEMWNDGPWSDGYETDEEALLLKFGLVEKNRNLDFDPDDPGMNEENNTLYMESLSDAITEIKEHLIASLKDIEHGKYPHRIYEYGVCIAKFHGNAQTEAHDLWEEVCNSTDDFGAYFETIDPDGAPVTIKMMEDD